MNPKLFLSVALVSVSTLVFFACGEAAPAPEVPPTPAEATPAAPAMDAPVALAPPARIETASAPALLARRELALGARPLALAACDFDADGFCDLAIATEKPGRVTILAGGPEGLADEGASLAVGDYPTNLAEVDGQLFVGSKATGELLCLEVTRTPDGLAPTKIGRASCRERV